MRVRLFAHNLHTSMNGKTILRVSCLGDGGKVYMNNVKRSGLENVNGIVEMSDGRRFVRE